MNPLAIALQGMGFEVAQIALQGFAKVIDQPIFVIGGSNRVVQVNEDDELLLLLM